MPGVIICGRSLCQAYLAKKYSYRDLPLRWAELGTVYRYEKDGVRHGLFRVRGFTQDDAHIFCAPEKIEDEIRFTVKFCLHILHRFGFKDITAYLSTRPEKAVGDPTAVATFTLAPGSTSSAKR